MLFYKIKLLKVFLEQELSKMIHTLLDRHPTYPRPTMFRDDYTLLNGPWDFCFDQDDQGLSLQYFNGFTPSHIIQVPFAYQTVASGIHLEKSVKVIWYQKKVFFKDHDRLLHFEGIDGDASIYLNGHLLYQGHASYQRISLSITDYVTQGENLIVIRVYDDYSTSRPRGKQRWQNENFGCWYVETSGIYKSVWVENIPSKTYIKQIWLSPQASLRQLEMKINVTGLTADTYLDINVSYKDQPINHIKTLATDFLTSVTVPMHTLSAQFKVHFWTPDTPHLYDIEIKVLDKDKVVDHVYSYVAMRDISVLQQSILLNHEPIYLKMILDQGYWPESGLTPPSLEALKLDIQLMKNSGFNGVRKHQKIEDERFYHLADLFGLLVWLEMPSHYEHNHHSIQHYFDLLPKVLDQYQNYQSIMTYVLFNESWGVPAIAFDHEQQQCTVAAYHLVKTKGTGRLVIGNDGWEHTVTDLVTLHHYTQSPAILKTIYQNPTVMFETLQHHLPLPRLPFAKGYVYSGQPLILSEYAGIASSADKGWGYGDKVSSKDEFHKRLYGLTKTVLELPHMQGYCITQLTDVEQETNGLFTSERKAKLSVDIYRKINEGIYES